MKYTHIFQGIIFLFLVTNCACAMECYERSCFGASSELPKSLLARYGSPMGDLGIEEKSSDANIALIKTAKEGDAGCATDLLVALSHGANVNFQDALTGKTAFHFCAKNGSLWALLVLIEHRADPFLIDCTGSTPLHVLMDEWQFNAALCVESFLSLEQTDRVKSLLLLKPGTRYGGMRFVRRNELHDVLAGSPAKSDSADSDKTSVGDDLPDASFDYSLFNAILKGDRFDVIRLLNSRDFPIDEGSPVFGITPLMLASQLGWVEGVDIFIRHRAQFFLPGEEEKNPLNIAARFGHTKLIKYLVVLDKKLSVTVKSCDGKSPLQLALENRHFDTAAFLLKVGFEFNFGALDFCARKIMSFEDFEDAAGSLRGFLQRYAPEYAQSHGF